MNPARLLGCAALLALAAGCGTIDPYRQPGTWRPEAANERNLAAMVINPYDLVRGHGDPRPQPRLATDAVRRLVAGVPTPLPSLSGDVAPGSGGSTAPLPSLGTGTGPAAPAPTGGMN